MRKELHTRLLEDTGKLRSLVAKCSTVSVAYTCAAKFATMPAEDHGLHSPQRQLIFLIGLLLSTPEPTTATQFDEKAWNPVSDLLNSIVSAYGYMYWPGSVDGETQDDERVQKREVTMSSFLHYFNSGLMASTPQLRTRIERYLSPFDADLTTLLGISASDAMKMTEWIGEQVLAKHDDLRRAISGEETARHNLLDKASQEGWSRRQISKAAQKSDYVDSYKKLTLGLNEQFKIEQDALERQFGKQLSRAFWYNYVLARGSISNLQYFTERNPVEHSPIVELQPGVAICLSVHCIYLAILGQGETALNGSSGRLSYLKRRDKVLEEEVASQLGVLFGKDAQLYRGVFETASLQYEHDIVVAWNRKLFIFEAKASPPVEPLRDPEKAITHITRHFRSERGIQKAYEQANRLSELHRTGQMICLYDAKRICVYSVAAADIDRVYCICVSRDNYGPLAIDLSMMLEKRDECNYPWATNTCDLENLIDAWDYFGWGPEKFCEYLDGRERMHGKAICFDELDFAGAFIAHGTLDIKQGSESAKILFDHSYAEVFDKIFYARQGGEPVEYSPHKPYVSDLSAEISKMRGERLSSSDNTTPYRRKGRKQGRNKPCACGSGMKYKRCCGRN